MGKRNDSRSDVQKDVEKYVFEQICEQLGDTTIVDNARLSIDADGKIIICPDFYSEESKIIGEIHAHIGRLKGSQPDKIASDILKMLL